MSWLKKILPSITSARKKNIPEGLWSKCRSCESVLYERELASNLYVCPKCGFHNRISARNRLKFFLDKDAQQEEIAKNISSSDPLKFKDKKKYKDRILSAQKATSESDALVVVFSELKGMSVVVAVFCFEFMGGSMGSAVGEKFVQAVNTSILNKCPLVCFSASGGARMQEGLFSLMQMSKTALALNMLSKAGIPFVSVITDPTMGGVSASIAMLGDINIAEPNAQIGFAGPRVIKQTVREELPEGFQSSEFLLTKGAIDAIVHRKNMRDEIHKMLTHLTSNKKIHDEN